MSEQNIPAGPKPTMTGLIPALLLTDFGSVYFTVLLNIILLLLTLFISFSSSEPSNVLPAALYTVTSTEYTMKISGLCLESTDFFMILYEKLSPLSLRAFEIFPLSAKSSCTTSSETSGEIFNWFILIKVIVLSVINYIRHTAEYFPSSPD